jgi:hypothetical protein
MIALSLGQDTLYGRTLTSVEARVQRTVKLDVVDELIQSPEPPTWTWIEKGLDASLSYSVSVAWHIPSLAK